MCEQGDCGSAFHYRRVGQEPGKEHPFQVGRPRPNSRHDYRAQEGNHRVVGLSQHLIALVFASKEAKPGLFLGLYSLRLCLRMKAICEVRPLRRLYSTFADGWPGVGLILMRLVAGAVLVESAVSSALGGPPVAIAIIPVVLAVPGVLLILGLYTPIVGSLVAFTEMLGILTVHAQRTEHILVAAFGAALAMLGPGSWSIDARLFGWKRIEPSLRKS
jgi:uncharacterized membrane protein YphA (DoxX/SURF4 family)